MGYLSESFIHAIELIFTFDREVQGAVWTSLYTSCSAIVLATIFGVPAGLLLGLSRFRGQQLLVTFLNTLMALPTVVIGLVLFGLLSRQGPLGSLGLLFTPLAMIAGQMVLATPIVANYVLAAVKGSDTRIIDTALTLGATRFQARVQLLKRSASG